MYYKRPVTLRTIFIYEKVAQSKIPVKYTRKLLFFAPLYLCVFALLNIQLTIT